MFRLNPFVRVGLCLSAISCAWPVLAVDDDGETMVVTASSVEQNLKDAPASISVITQEDLQRKPVQNLKDVLKEVPGVQLTNEGDNRKGVSIRGLDSSYTLILVDGKRVNSRNAVFRHNDFDLNWIPVDSIERIEVVRGPMSSLYGSDALGGVVNITGLPLLILSPLVAMLLGMDVYGWQVMALTLLLGTPTLGFLGAPGVALTVGLKRGGVLLSILVLPLTIPLLIFATAAMDAASMHLPVDGYLAILGALLAGTATLSPFATAAALRISIQ
ncbi:heme exporter protein CcmB [Escherichia coli]